MNGFGVLARRRKSKHSITWAIIFAAALGGASGCGGGSKYPKPVPVAGKVTVAGKPLESGKLHFVPKDAKTSLRGYAKVEAGGSFAVSTHRAKDGLTPGDYTVFIETDPPTGDAKLKTPEIKAAYLTPASPKKVIIDSPVSDLTIDFQ